MSVSYSRRPKEAASEKYNKPTSKLQQKRIDVGFSQSEMARLSGLEFRQYQWLEKNGNVANKNLALTIRLCEILNCKFADILDNEEDCVKLEWLANNTEPI